MRARTRRRRRRRRARCSKRWWTPRRGWARSRSSPTAAFLLTFLFPIPPTGAARRGAAVHRGGEGDGQLRPRLGHRRHRAVGLCGAVARLGPVRRAGSGTALSPHTLPCVCIQVLWQQFLEQRSNVVGNKMQREVHTIVRWTRHVTPDLTSHIPTAGAEDRDGRVT